MSHAAAAVPTTINDFFLAGSQPLESGSVNQISTCSNCHAGYNQTVEPVFNWKGSMMGQALRDPIFLACLTVANQDAPEVGDLCLRCHTPGGWLEGRSEPTDGSALTAADRNSVHCEVCHRLVPVQGVGENPFPEDAAYTSGCWPVDQNYVATLDLLPTHAADGMFMVSTNMGKRGPYIGASAQHPVYYTPYQRAAALCGTCHDVSNPVFDRQESGAYMPNAFA